MAKDETAQQDNLSELVQMQAGPGGWITYYQVIGDMPVDGEGHKAVFALSRELPTEQAAIKALTLLRKNYPMARLQRAGCDFDDEISAKAFVDFINSDEPITAKGKVLASWHHSSTKKNSRRPRTGAVLEGGQGPPIYQVPWRAHPVLLVSPTNRQR